MTSTVDAVKSSLYDVTSGLALTLPHGPTLEAFRHFDGDFNEDDVETSKSYLAELQTLAESSTLPFAEHLYTISQRRWDVKSKGTMTESELVGIIANLSAVCVQLSKRAYASDEAEEGRRT